MSEKWEHRIYYFVSNSFSNDTVEILSSDPKKYFEGTLEEYLNSKSISFSGGLFGKDKPRNVITSLWLSEGFQLVQREFNSVFTTYLFSKKID